MMDKKKAADRAVSSLETENYCESLIAEYLETDWMAKNILFYESTDSTNAQAHLAAQQGAPDGTLVVADMQTAGRGRRGRSWESPVGTNLYFSLLLRPKFAADNASMLTLLMAYAVYQAVEQVVESGVRETAEDTRDDIIEQTDEPVRCGIKWPNDIVIDGKKVCGILTEMYLEEASHYHVIIGVGVNVGKQLFPSGLVDKATCLADVCGSTISRSHLIADILKVFETEYEAFCKDPDLELFKEKYNRCLINKDRGVCVLDPKGEYCGIARGINSRGELLVELEEGLMQTVYAGEVSVRGIYGYV